MSKPSRIKVVSPLGRLYHLSVSEVEHAIGKKRMQWIEVGVSAMDVVSQEYLGCSQMMGPHYDWRPKDSGGATVLQLT